MRNLAKEATKCLGAQRHMTASEYLTYDGMLAMSRSRKAKERMEREQNSDRLFYGSMITLANRNNTSPRTEERNVASLLRKEWIAVERPQVHWRGGKWSTVRYIVWTHEEYIDCGIGGIKRPTHECPALKYDPETGEQVIEGKPKNPNLARSDMRKRINVAGVQCDLPDWMLDAPIEAKKLKRPTATLRGR